MKSMNLFIGLVSVISLVASANSSLKIWVDGRPFDADVDKLKVGAKVRVECKSADSSSFASALVFGDDGNRARSGSSPDGYVKGSTL